MKRWNVWAALRRPKDLCVFPRRLIPQRRSRVNYDLCAANGTTIPTYGWLPLSLNLGLRRDFTWRFVVADVTQPLIGVDFLSHFGLLIDCKHNRLLDGVTSLSAPAQAASLRTTSIKCASVGPAVDSILSEFPDLTRPTGVQREVRHNTVHHILISLPHQYQKTKFLYQNPLLKYLFSYFLFSAKPSIYHKPRIM
jgi:hypothetical protein